MRLPQRGRHIQVRMFPKGVPVASHLREQGRAVHKGLRSPLASGLCAPIQQPPQPA